jgi:hypothetical protein
MKTPMDYGAAGDGSTNDYAALQAALQSGNIIDGMGLTYALDQGVVITSNFAGFQNATLKWRTNAAMVRHEHLLRLENLSNWFVDRVNFDLGVERYSNGYGDNIRGGLVATRTDNNANNRNEHFRITNCTVWGFGSGTGIEIRWGSKGVVANNIVRDREAFWRADGLNLSGVNGNYTGMNDIQNGILIDRCECMTVANNVVHQLLNTVDQNTQPRWSRGFCIMSTRDSTFTGNSISIVDQAMDFSGDSNIVGTDGLGGNVNNTISGNAIVDVTTWGIKLANATRDCIVSNNTVRRFGLSGIVLSGSSSGDGITTAQMTQRNTIQNNHVLEPVPNGWGGCVPIRCMVTTNSAYPRDNLFTANRVNGNNVCQNGFSCDVSLSSGNFWQINRVHNVNGADYGGGGISSTNYKTL